MRTSLTLAAAVAALALGTALPNGADAQSNPNSDQIINSLRPTGSSGGLTRGIRPVGPSSVGSSDATPAAAAAPAARPGMHNAASAPSTASSAPPSTAAAATGGGAPSVNLTVQFATGSAQLTPAAIHTLDELGRALSSATLASYKFRIEGHTDTVGSPASNKSLSEQRAAAVVDYLSNKFNIDKSRLTAVGMGEDGLLVQTPQNTAEPRNRRVQVVNLGA